MQHASLSFALTTWLHCRRIVKLPGSINVPFSLLASLLTQLSVDTYAEVRGNQPSSPKPWEVIGEPCIYRFVALHFSFYVGEQPVNRYH